MSIMEFGEGKLRDQNFSEKICEELQVPFRVYAADVPRMAAEKKLSLEEAGREARRTAFEKLAGEYGKPQGGSGEKRYRLLWHTMKMTMRKPCFTI